MAKAYVLINCKAGYENSIIKKLIEIPEVKEVEGVLGDYDIFVKLESYSQGDLEKIIVRQIRKIPDILATNSFHPIPSQGGK